MSQHAKQSAPEIIGMPQSFFKKTLREYNNWTRALFREFLQNSIDAKATRIDFIIEDHSESDGVYVVCQDNGKGMSESIIRNGLLCLGGTVKDEGSVGGFGYAKMILYFAHESYRVRTRDILVEGHGCEYNLTSGLDYLEGVRSEVMISKNADVFERYLDTPANILGNALTEIVERSWFETAGIEVTLNGEPLDWDTADSDGYEIERKTDIGTLYVQERQHAHNVTLNVRYKGLLMFSLKSPASGSGIYASLHLKGDGLDMFTTNRDMLRDHYGVSLNELFNKLANDSGFFMHQSDLTVFLNDTLGESRYSFALADAPEIDPITGKTNRLVESVRTASTRIIDASRDKNYPRNFVIQVQNAEIRANRQLHGIRTPISSVCSALNKQHSQKLAFIWEALIACCLSTEYAQKHFDARFFNLYGDVVEWDCGMQGDWAVLTDTTITSGFVMDLSGRVEGMKADANGPNHVAIMINPMLQLTQNMSSFEFGDLIDLATHEITHISASGHNEYFILCEAELRRSLRRYGSESDIKRWCFDHMRMRMEA